MTHHLLIARTLEKKLSALRQAGKRGRLAVTQCESLLDQMSREGPLAEEVYRKRTKNGENRISNCVKYDLGSGYRLITVKDGQNIFVPFVGGHDETDLWLDHHRYDGYLADDPAFVSEDIRTGCQPNTEHRENIDLEEHPVIDVYEEQLLAKIDETLLKTVFQGLFQKQQA
ncbi:MAG: hypothetical protein WBB19_06075 [Desulforhopalus sp.]